MMLAAAGLLFTTLNSALYDMTLTACESQVGNYELACKEVNKKKISPRYDYKRSKYIR